MFLRWSELCSAEGEEEEEEDVEEEDFDEEEDEDEDEDEVEGEEDDEDVSGEDEVSYSVGLVTGPEHLYTVLFRASLFNGGVHVGC